MNEFSKMFNEKMNPTMLNACEAIEQEIKKIIVEYDCKPSQIQLRMYPKYRYEIYVKASEFEMEPNFIVCDIDQTI